MKIQVFRHMNTVDEWSRRKTLHSVTMEAEIPSELGVTMNESTLRHDPEDSNLDLKLKTVMVQQ